MDGVDGTDHESREETETPPSLLNIIIDTNPRAWALLKHTLPLSKLIASLQVFINAHLAIKHTNQVTVIASHAQQAEFLYPPRREDTNSEADVEMSGIEESEDKKQIRDDANFYRPFAEAKSALDKSLAHLLEKTEAATVSQTYTTCLAGALTLALTYTNKISVNFSEQNPSVSNSSAQNEASASTSLNARILVISASSANASQYIPLMNTVFAAQRLRIPIDVLSIPLPTSKQATSPDLADASASFLQQATDATSGVFLPLTHPDGVLQTLFLAYLPSGQSRAMLLMPATQGVDFRAACFCHQNTVDVGYVCSICLSIFCHPPADGECLTCGSPLKTGGEGWAKVPAVLPKRKKRRRREDGDTGTSTPLQAGESRRR